MSGKSSGKRLRVLSSDEEVSHVGGSEDEQLVKIEAESTLFKETIDQMEIGLNSIKTDVEETKKAMEQKADKSKIEALESEWEELRNRSRRTYVVFYNVSEKAEGDDFAGFIQDFHHTWLWIRSVGKWKSKVHIERQASDLTNEANKHHGKYTLLFWGTQTKLKSFPTLQQD